MKIRMYMDLYGGIDPSRSYVSASNIPLEKSPSCKRIAFDVTIPDALIFGFDAIAPEVGNIEQVSDDD